MAYDETEGRGLGARFWLLIMGCAVGAVLAGVLLFILLGWAWYAWGGFGALLLFALVLLGFGYIHDRRAQERYNSLPE